MIEKVLSFFSEPVFAQEPPRIGQLAVAVDKVMGWIFPAGVLIAVIMIIVGGYMWIISGGDPAKKQLAQGTLTWSVIGLVLLFLVYGILSAIIGALMG